MQPNYSHSSSTSYYSIDSFYKWLFIINSLAITAKHPNHRRCFIYNCNEFAKYTICYFLLKYSRKVICILSHRVNTISGTSCSQISLSGFRTEHYYVYSKQSHSQAFFHPGQRFSLLLWLLSEYSNKRQNGLLVPPGLQLPGHMPCQPSPSYAPDCKAYIYFYNL